MRRLRVSNEIVPCSVFVVMFIAITPRQLRVDAGNVTRILYCMLLNEGTAQRGKKGVQEKYFWLLKYQLQAYVVMYVADNKKKEDAIRDKSTNFHCGLLHEA